MVSRFALAPMPPWLRTLTWALFAVPVALLAAANVSPPQERLTLLITFLVVIVIYASIWLLCRPSRFEIGPDGLRIVWPMRSRLVRSGTIEEVRVLSGEEFRREYGWGTRIGAGGLWGGFGLLRTRKATFSMWISRLDGFVLLRLAGARPLLVTPEAPDRFVDEIRRIRP